MSDFTVNENLQLGEQTTVKPELKTVEVEVKERTDKRALCIEWLQKVLSVVHEAQSALPEESGTSRAIGSLKSHLNYVEGQTQYLINELPN